MKITKRQLKRIIKEEMGYDIPEELLKAEVLNFVDRYFIDSASGFDTHHRS